MEEKLSQTLMVCFMVARGIQIFKQWALIDDRPRRQNPQTHLSTHTQEIIFQRI